MLHAVSLSGLTGTPNGTETLLTKSPVLFTAAAAQNIFCEKDLQCAVVQKGPVSGWTLGGKTCTVLLRWRDIVSPLLNKLVVQKVQQKLGTYRWLGFFPPSRPIHLHRQPKPVWSNNRNIPYLPVKAIRFQTCKNNAVLFSHLHSRCIRDLYEYLLFCHVIGKQDFSNLYKNLVTGISVLRLALPV